MINRWDKTYRTIYNRCYCKYRKSGIKCLITPSELKILWFRDKAYLMNQPSIDRIDTYGNYTFENCRYIELSENMHRRKRKDLKLTKWLMEKIDAGFTICQMAQILKKYPYNIKMYLKSRDLLQGVPYGMNLVGNIHLTKTTALKN